MKTVNPREAAIRPPDARIIFTEGDYDHALKCYFVARTWAVNERQVYRQDVYAIINHPYHAECPLGVRVVPERLLKKQGWGLSIDIWTCDDETTEGLKALRMPKSARLQIEPKLLEATPTEAAMSPETSSSSVRPAGDHRRK